ncbi:DoxX family membrane protein [Halomonas huangheensis]|uniref:DoxX family protein n=1 Tax=Halomonas huangheensis TaxID=1178482 RepID=W1NBM5_9GAMM|nr:DoxX family membrane protein [Halomonas huangheensis]ALM53770.1 hypothetical protein AR456_16935 [Halomonas huangheensis]ERL52305.1 hypothetical protein BJB45_10075 [Halomonas huangheensis]
MQRVIDGALDHLSPWAIARTLLVAIFMAAGVLRITHPQVVVDEMRAAGLEPAALLNMVVAINLLVAAVLILLERLLWLGAAVQLVFLVLIAVVVHQYCKLPGSPLRLTVMFAIEHLTAIGGLLAVAMISHLRQLMGIAPHHFPSEMEPCQQEIPLQERSRRGGPSG